VEFKKKIFLFIIPSIGEIESYMIFMNSLLIVRFINQFSLQ